MGGILTLESGLPLDPTISVNMSGTGAVVTSTSNGTGGSFRAPFLERNSFRQEERKTFDMRLSKGFNISNRGQLVLLWEAFNLFNTVNYTAFGTIRYNGAASYNAAANTATVTLTENTGFLCRRPPATRCSARATCSSVSSSSGNAEVLSRTNNRARRDHRVFDFCDRASPVF